MRKRLLQFTSKSLVLGYGKIGKILSKDLYALGAQTYVEARKYADLAMIEGHGYEPLPLENLKDHIHEFDIIFNTIPSLILDDEILAKVKKTLLLSTLPPNPGIDFDAAKSYGLKVIWALSLPGKIAPVRPEQLSKTTIMNIIKELGCNKWIGKIKPLVLQCGSFCTFKKQWGI